MAEDDPKPATDDATKRNVSQSGNLVPDATEPARAIVPTPHQEPSSPLAPAPAQSVDHPPRAPQEITPDPSVRERKPLNPAYAILAGAVLTAASGITATFLTIRSSERLTRERDRTDLARQERDDLAKELEKVKTELANQSEQLQQFSSTTIAAPVVTQPTVPPSIVVVLPPQATVVPTVTVAAPTTKAPAIPEERPPSVAEPTVAPTTTPTASTTTAAPVQVSTTVTTTPTTTTLAPPSAAAAGVGTQAPAPTTTIKP